MKTYMLIATIGLSASSLAWHDAGHRAVALIAWNELDASEKGRISSLLGSLPESQVPKNSFAYPTIAPYTLRPGLRTFQATLMDAAVWPDKVRKPTGNWMHKANWHYKDLPVHPVGWIPRGGDDGMAGEQIPAMVKVLRDPNQSESTRAAALAWLTHLVGDVHQPLHGAAFFDRLHRKGDRGGNDYFLKRERGRVFVNDARNLHSYWDGLGNRDRDSVEEIVLEAGQTAFSTPVYSPEVIGAQTKVWLTESWELAKSDVYRSAPNSSEWLDPFASNPYSDAYHQNCRAIVFKRIQLAGKRLAAVLKAVLSN